MRNCKPIDIEEALAAYLYSMDVDACAPPVPKDLDAPKVVVYRTGGTSRAYVQDVHSLSIDCYAHDTAQAMELANRMCLYVRNLQGEKLGGMPVYTADANLPYNNPDPRNYELARATFTAQVATRSIHE